MDPVKILISKKNPVFFISPHLDDAIFSAGGLIAHLQKTKVVSVVNVFTQADSKSNTISAKAFLHQTNFTSANDLYTSRKKEDAAVLAKLKINPTNLDFFEALWRFKGNRWKNILPEMDAIYPTYRWHVSSGRLAVSDKPNLDKLIQILTNLIPKNAIVFAPLGIGNHVDHIFVREAVAVLPNTKLFWADYPYHARTGLTSEYIKTHTLKKLEFNKHKPLKKKLMMAYTSQFPAVFPHGISKVPSEYYYFDPKNKKWK